MGPIYNIATKGSNVYISSLCAIQRSPITTLKLPGQDMHLLHPLDSASIKSFTSIRHLSLMSVFHVAIGPAMGLVPASQKFLTDPDAGIFKRELSKLFNNELRSLQNLRKYASQLDLVVESHWQERAMGQKPDAKLRLGAWLFDLLSYSMGSVFWGQAGPFEDEGFRTQLRLFIQHLEELRNPITWLIPKDYTLARDSVRKAIGQAVRDEAYGKEQTTLFGHLATLYGSLDIPQEAFTDCHLVAIVGLMSNVINMITWALCNIIADSKLMADIYKEIEAIATPSSSSPDLKIDADQIRSSSPLLVATWYELLRTYGDAPVARGVYEDSLFADKYRVQKGSFIMTPIHLHNFERTIWGDDADEFRPRRFLRAGSDVDKDLVKHLNVFGLPGMHQCPGRYLAMNMTLGILAKTLLTFVIKPAAGDELEKGVVPKQKDTMLGLPAMARDPEVVVGLRKQVKSVRVIYDNVRPGI
ncbi:hypothetical protein CKAH01_17920 [Colletotrichum kahawae]|uniref:Cytochrome P450 n=1 Tax=Colletotrichum kahawae TaxID=34407 RepID=A0AAD9YBL7_COLKA|nr:hypothetical protein CKAH01_17920 [Colletotrichum kahawae]